MDDKTTKIPSLKEFQKAQQEHDKRKKQAGSADKNRKSALKGDTNRVELNRNKTKSSRNPSADKTKTYKPESKAFHQSRGNVSGSTQKIDNKRIREAENPDDRFKAFESDVTYQSRRASSSQPLTQKRVAGQRPDSYRHPQQRNGQAVNPSQRQPQQRSGQAVNQSQRPDARRPSNQMPPKKRPPRPQTGRENVQNQPSRKPPQKPRKPISPFARKAKRILIYVLIVAAILTVGVVLSLTVLFKTENIVVNVPDNFYSSQDIIDASGLHYQENIFMAGKARAEQRLEEKFPYIKSAHVTAVIPDTITIDITLCTPSFAVKTSSLTYIASEDSKVLEVTSTADEVDVPLIEGVEVKDAKAGETLSFQSSIVRDSLSEMFNFAKEKGYKNITRVDIETQHTASGTDTLEIRYVYDDRIVVYIGLPENITYKMQTAQTIIAEKIDVNNSALTGELDVSNSYDTKKSYFNQYSLIPDAVITEPSTETTTTEAKDNADEYVEDYDGEYAEDYGGDYGEDYVEDSPDAYEEDYVEEY